MWHFTENIMQTKIDWFEIPSRDFQRAVKFYEAVFDTRTKVEAFGPNQLAIFSVAGGESIGCVIHGDDFRPNPDGVVLYLNANQHFDQVLARVVPAGGQIKLDKMALPKGMGFIAHILDTEGNRLGLHAEV
jgi:hypothetical protein